MACPLVVVLYSHLYVQITFYFHWLIRA